MVISGSGGGGGGDDDDDVTWGCCGGWVALPRNTLGSSIYYSVALSWGEPGKW